MKEFNINLGSEISSEMDILKMEKQVYDFLNSMKFNKKERKHIAEVLTIYASIFIEAAGERPLITTH